MRIILLALIESYRLLISPFFVGSCRFHPSCSDYARGAILEFGAGRGMVMAIRRLSHCHPFHAGGYDPVPAHPHRVDLKSQISDLKSESDEA